MRELSLKSSFISQDRLERMIGNPGSMSWSVSDQALISASNFTMMLLVARATTPKEFGTFVLTFTVLLFVNSIQASLISAPHNVLGAQKSGREYQRYTSSLLLIQVIGSILISVLTGLAILGLQPLIAIDQAIVMFLPAAILCWQLQEFTRRVLYTDGNFRGAFIADSVTYGGQMGMVFVLYLLDDLGGVSALATISIASILGTLVGIWMIKHHLVSPFDARRIILISGENLKFGKWLLGSSVMTWTSIYLYPILTAGFIGVAATGGIRAVQNLVSPTHILLKTMESTLPSRASRTYEAEGKHQSWAYLGKTTKPILLLLTLYCIVISLTSKVLVEAVLGTSYEAYWWFVPVLAIGYALLFYSTVADIFLRSMGRTRPIFTASLTSSLVVLTFGIWLVITFGLHGAAIGMVLHGVIVNTYLWIVVRRELGSK